MIKVEFSNRQDCEQIYNQIMNHIENGNYEVVFGVSVKKVGKELLYITFDRDEVTFQYVIQPMLSHVFADYILATFELTWLRDVLKENFYYEDKDEIQEIVSLFYSIMNGKRTDLPNVTSIPSRQGLIENAVNSLLDDSFKKELSFSFDSFLKFRMKEYRECILTYIEMAIDEYKLEQDYQSFIENLRSFLGKKTPIMNVLHIVYTNKPVFFDEHFHLIHEEQITRAMNNTSFFSHQSLIEPTLLQPLLTFAPKEVIVYADDDQTGILYTLKNIFQERLSIRSLKEVPDMSTSS
ncbi:sporulation protein YtxC [Pueribacillus sp. YX66]|uniref:sporulation protein YtxC n=1 Tax=Pueribacillus sp. YX66 TaxID=3229242 RepID=UPI00358D7820